MKTKYLIILNLIFFGCKEKKNILVDISNRDSIKGWDLLERLDNSMKSHRAVAINAAWDSILQDENIVIGCLIKETPENKIDFFWIDTLKRNNPIRVYSNVTTKIARLHLLCAIYYRDLYFSFDRKLYNDNAIKDIPKDKGMSWTHDIAQSMSDIHYADIWASIIEWNRNGRKKRPLYKTPYYWLGENGGKLTFENSFHYYIH